MSLFKVQIVAGNPGNKEMVSLPLEALVDTGSELTWLPGNILREIGVLPRCKRLVPNAAKQLVERDVGCVVLHSHGRKTEDEVVFAEPGDPAVLGIRTLNGFGVTIDDPKHRFVSLTSLMPFLQSELPKAA